MSVNTPGRNPLELEYPHKVAEFRTYAEAQEAVDHLSDEKFPVQNLVILGTNLRTVERVTGRRTWATVLVNGAISGLGTGVFVALMLWFFYRGFAAFWFMLLVGLVMGAVFGLVTSAIGYSLSGGRRDFDSMRQTIATAYELQCEHKVADEARRILDARPGARAAAFE